MKKISIIIFVLLLVTVISFADNITTNTTINNTPEINTTINETPEVTTTIINPEPVTLLKTFVGLILQKVTYLKGETINIQAQLSYDNNSPLVDKDIDFYLDENLIGTDSTNYIGVAAYDLHTSNLAAGTRDIEVQFAGNDHVAGDVDYGIIKINDTSELTQVIPGVEVRQDCRNITWEEEEDVYGICSEDYLVTLCDDEPLNTSCSEVTKQHEYSCYQGQENIQKTKQECQTTGYVINNVVDIDTSMYSCSTTEEGENIVLLCDSKFDGNGDGICTSGESCQKFVVNNNNFEAYEKNSKENFMLEDNSFFIDRASVEVLK